jgi:hypothetical protein
VKRRKISFALLFALATPVAAQANAVCDDLRGRLADLPEVIGNGPDVRKYANAIAEQNLELRNVRSDLRRYRCTSGSMVVIGGENADYCGELEQSEAKMVDNIRYLEDRRDEARGQGGEDYQVRRQLMAALEDKGCNEEEQAPLDDEVYAPAPSAEEQAKREDTFIPLGGGNQYGSGYDVPQQELLSHVTTVCVRTCDGGFFPIRSNATSIDFNRDADTCSKMCPGIETQLFYHDVTNTDASNMISTSTGAPYSAMPKAFSYKNRKPGEKSSCSCNLSAYYEKMRKNQEISEPPQRGSITTIQTKPGTAKTTAGPAPETQVPDRPYDPVDSKVRQVGPQFLPGQQGAIDLKNPAVPGPQPAQ